VPDEWWVLAVAGAAALLTAGGAFLALYTLRHLERRQEHRLDAAERHVEARIEAAERQLAALINIRPLSGPLPVDLGGWSSEPVLVDRVLREVERRQPAMVVECGSGWSTLLVGLCLRELGRGELVALEHDDRQARRSCEMLRRHGAGERARVVLAPLRLDVPAGPTRLWYGIDADDLFPVPIDLLLVDGPPGAVGRRARYPAVPLLRDRLAPDALIILDDGHREDERWISDQWAVELGVRPELVPWGAGMWIFDLAERKPAPLS
jgi:predicted O-methyltransferase YrrM